MCRLVTDCSDSRPRSATARTTLVLDRRICGGYEVIAASSEADAAPARLLLMVRAPPPKKEAVIHEPKPGSRISQYRVEEGSTHDGDAAY
jgi:hypothetical protein